MIILGFDLSTKYIGFAVTDEDGQRVDSGEVKLEGRSFEDRLKNAIVRLDIEVGNYDQSGYVAVEAPFVGPNGQTSLQLGKLGGALYSITYQLTGHFPIEVTPSEIKRAMTGNGQAGKALMMQLARARYALESVGEHEADALAVCLAATIKLQQRHILDAVGS